MMMHHPILSHHNKAATAQVAQHNNHNNQYRAHYTWGSCALVPSSCVCAELNGKVVCMWCAPFTLTDMLGDVNYWPMYEHIVITNTPAHAAHLMPVIDEKAICFTTPLSFSLSLSLSETLRFLLM